MSEVDTQVEVQLMTEFDKLKEQLNGLKQPLIDFKRAIGDLSTSVREVNNLAQAFNELNRVNFTKTTEQISRLQTVLGNVSAMVQTNKQLLSNFETTMSRIGSGAKSVAKGFNEINQALENDFSEKLSNVATSAKNFQTINFKEIDTKTLDRLVKGLSDLAKVDVSSLESINTQNISQLVGAMSNLSTKVIDTETLKTAIEMFGKLQAFDGNKIKNEFELLNTINLERFSQMVKDVNERIQPLHKLLSGLHTRVNKLNDRLSKVNFDVFDGAEERLGTIIPYIRTLNDNMGQLAQSKSNVSKNSLQTAENIEKVGKSANKVKSEISTLTKKFRNFFSLGNIYFLSNYFQSTFGRFGNALKNALDFTETENLFARSMNNMYGSAMKFQNKLGEMYGLAVPTMMKAQATYKNMIGNLGGLSEELSYKISEIVTKMTLDFSSLYNVDFEKASQKFQSALSKQVRPIRSISGFDITQNVLETTARDLGIERPLRKMNELEKRMLVILTLMQQMQNSRAMNDFSRTIELHTVALYCKI